MSSLITPGQPARRLLLLLNFRSTISYQNPIHPPHMLLPQFVHSPRNRQFAQNSHPARPPARSPARPSPSSTASARLSAKGSEAPRLIFSQSDVPPIKDWTQSIEGLGAQHLTPLQCVDAAQRYVSAATQHESSWRPRLEKDFDLPVSLLHWIGILLISDSSAVRWRLGTHMLRSASELGYDPSTLSLVRIFSSVPLGMQKKVASSKIYIDANARFQKILRQGTDPDALTLQGIILAKSGVDSQGKQALDLFRRAEKAWELKAKSSAQGDHGAQAGASSHTSDTQSFNIEEGAIPDYVSLPEPRTPRWDWEVSWALEQGKILQRQNRHKEARALFRVAALELDNPQGFWQLACLMDVPQDSPERRTYLLKAAISGVQEACRELGLLEKMAAEKTGLGEKDRTDREMMSREWFRLADGEDLKLIQDEEEA